LLDELDERLKTTGVTADPKKVASALLSIAVIHNWNGPPQNVVEWMESMAVELAQSWPKPPH
jgi:hypothetical protein